MPTRPPHSPLASRCRTACARMLPALLVLALVTWSGPAGAGPADDLARARWLERGAAWAEAESLATTALGTLERGRPGDSLAIAEACLLGGEAHMRRSGYADGAALAWARRALAIRLRRLGPADPAVAEAELLLGRVLQGADQRDSALVHLRRAVEIRAAALAPDDTLIAEAWDQLALLQRDRREFRAAIDSWDRAIAVRTRRDGADSAPVALLSAQTGACWMELGDLARARQVLEGSLAIFRRIGAPDHPSRWVPLNILADLEKREGDLARNVDLLQEALRTARATFGPDSRQALTVGTNLAVALLNFGDEAGARVMFESVYPRYLAQYGSTNWRTDQIRLGLAITAARLGDTAAALRGYAEVESLLALRPETSASDLPTAEQLHALLLADLGRDREALAMCDRADRTVMAERVPSGDVLALIQFVRIRALVALGDTAALDSARRRLDVLSQRHALRSSRFAPDMMRFASVADARLGRGVRAWAEALVADSVARDNARANLRRLSDRRGLEYARGSAAALEQVLDLSRGDGARAATAWDRLARNRAMVGLESVRRAVPEGFEHDTTVVGAHEDWRAAEGRYAAMLVSAPRGDSAAAAALERAHQGADEAERVYARLLDEHGAGTVPSERGIADVHAALRPGQAMVALAVTHAASDTAWVSAFVLRGGAPETRRIELGRLAALRAVLDPWRRALATPPGDGRATTRAEGRCRRLGAEVRARVWDPLVSGLAGVNEVFVVADGPLADLPWPALPDGPGRYLVEHGPLVHPLDAESEVLDRTPVATTGRLLALGDPDFDNAAAPAAGGAPVVAALVRSAPDPCADVRALRLPPLPGSGAEAQGVANAWDAAGMGPALVLTGAGASEGAFKRAAHGNAVIHLATHGVMRGDRCAESEPGSRGVGGIAIAGAPAALGRHEAAAPGPVAPPAAEASPWLVRRVWLALAGANHAAEHVGDDDEGLLTAEEVSTLDLSGTDWVVLSACHSGVGGEWSSEGRLGMRRAFALAGARSVIASAWALDDATTGAWMRELYRARLAGVTDASTAIAAASRAVLAERRATRRSTHPFYWAAFSASGH